MRGSLCPCGRAGFPTMGRMRFPTRAALRLAARSRVVWRERSWTGVWLRCGRWAVLHDVAARPLDFLVLGRICC
eukprot:14285135-Alexandrium_andersonii.AAC.1